MKPGSRNWKKFIRIFGALAKTLLAIGLLLFLLDVSNYPLIFSGGVYAVYLFSQGFSPIHEQPSWELVYPELALGHDDNFETNLKNKEDETRK